MVNTQKLVLLAFGAYNLGAMLTRLEWVLTVSANRLAIISMLAPLRQYKDIERFETIGEEVAVYHEALSKDYSAEYVLPAEMTTLRQANSRWATIATERLADVYLVTPIGILQSKALMQGLPAFLSEEDMLFVNANADGIEAHDLLEACNCLLVGSTTAAEQISLRAAESMLRRWHTAKTGKTIARRAWGAVFDALEKEYPPGPQRPDELAALGFLNLRRNAIDHPQIVSKTADSEATLLMICSLVGQLRVVMAALPPQPASLPETDSSEQ